MIPKWALILIIALLAGMIVIAVLAGKQVQAEREMLDKQLEQVEGIEHKITRTLPSEIAQHGFEFETTPHGILPPLRYAALAACLHRVKRAAIARCAPVHMPRIGCGLAGGEWNIVEEWVQRALCRFDVPVTVYDLP